MEEKELFLFGELAVKLGYTTQEKVDQCLALQNEIRKIGGVSNKIGEIMVARGYLKVEDVKVICEYQEESRISTEIQGYKIVSKVGRGAMGNVYKATQLSLDRTVAIKVLLPKFAKDKKIRERFILEARAAGKLNCPNIVQYFDIKECDDICYVIMEYVDGKTVAEMIRDRGVLDEKYSLNIISQVASALDYAHRYGIVHRDIKPANIMINKDGIVKVCDFCLAKDLLEGDKEKGRVIMGTPFYISPEQATGEKNIDIRSDIYSLGATFYHMITGVPPFVADSQGAVINKHLTEAVVPPMSKNHAITPATNYVILKMLAKDRNARYQTPNDLLVDLHSILVGKSPPIHIQQSSVKKPLLLLKRNRYTNIRKFRKHF